MAKISWMVFDLGGVLFDFYGAAEIARLLDLTESAAQEVLVRSRAVEDFETGRIDPSSFAQRFAGELGLSVTADRMLELWASWEGGPKPGAVSLLESLRKQGPIACLTNNNRIHWERLSTRYGAESLFDRCYLSHEIGLQKPDPRLFEHLTADLGTPAREIVYFDDRADIVEAAEAFGLAAHQATCPDDIRAILAAV